MQNEGGETQNIRLARGGDEAAFAALVERYAKPVLNFAWRIIGDATEAEDIAQETFVRAWRHLPSYNENNAAVSTWLFQIARNASLDRLRKSNRKPASPLDDLKTEPASAQPGPADSAEQNELGRAIAAAVAALPEDQRTAFILAEYHGQTMREISAVMDCSEKSVEGRLARARKLLRETLKTWK